MLKEYLKKNVCKKSIGRIRDFKHKHIEKQKYAIGIDITNGCNFHCTFCPRNNEKISFMSTEDFNSILIKISKNINSLLLCCAWEFAIAKNAAEIVGCLKNFKIPHITIYSNGSNMTNTLANAVIDAKVNHYTISIGEAKKETYERIRRGGNFQKTLANIKKLNEVKKERNSNYPIIGANLTLMNSNIDELIDFVYLANDIGVNHILGRPLILNAGLDVNHEIITDHDKANKIIELARIKALELNIDFSIPSYNKDEVVDNKNCKAPWNRLYIACDGGVSICPRVHKYVCIGNLLEQPLKDIIKGEKICEIKKQFLFGTFDNPVCPICQQNLEEKKYIDQGF